MKILHLASFNGNVGDNASHMGLYNFLNDINPDCNFDQIEIRKFYKNYTGILELSPSYQEYMTLLTCKNVVVEGKMNNY